LSPIFYREMARQAPGSLRPRAAVTIAVRLARALLAERWMKEYLRSARDGRPDVVYSWWSFAEAYGISRALRGTGIPFVVRAHGYDLFAEQEAVGFVPFQRRTIEQATRVISASLTGADYLCSRYPDLTGRITTSYLGTADPGARTEPSADGILRIVTCSSNIPVKRVDLLARGLSHLATTQPDIAFHWTHIGSGPLADNLKSLISTLPGLASQCATTGPLEPAEVKHWYRTHQIDLFVNTSFSEGLPVSLMEAASFGIPMMATSVGGNPEIVNEANGVLLGCSPSPEELSTAIGAFARLTNEERATKRAASRETFLGNFNAEVNYRRFATLLADLSAP
jgi:glycosyltransferase involved in cell wall biosynthesis